MAKITQKIPAKINLTLDVKGKIGNLHEIESLVISVDIYDKITVKKRKDDKITLKEKGILTFCKIEDNNAYKTAKLFQETYQTKGVDIIIKKKIPLAGGLGGSSADIVGVLIAMNKLFRADADLKKLSAKLGSDVVYMLNGGFSLMTETGNKSVKLNLGFPLYFIILTNGKGIPSKDCYEKFDLLGESTESTSRDAFSYLLSKEFEKFKKVAKNDLYKPAKDILPELVEEMEILNKENADFLSMTGAGSSLFMMFKDKKRRDIAFKNLKKTEYKKRILKAESVE